MRTGSRLRLLAGSWLLASIAVAAGSAAAQASRTVHDGSGDANLFKLGYADFAFQDDTTVVTGDLTPPEARLDIIDTGTLAGSYTRFVGDHLGLELLFGLPVEIDIDGDGSIADRGEVATVKALPPTLLFGYYPFGRRAALRPYVAVALNHTIFYDAEPSQSLQDLVLGEPEIDLSSSTDIGGFVGLNYRVTGRLHVSGLAGYVPIETTADLVTDTFFPVPDGTQIPLGTIERSVDVEVNPFVFLGTVGVSF